LNDFFFQLENECFLQVANDVVRLTDSGRLIVDAIAVTKMRKYPIDYFEALECLDLPDFPVTNRVFPLKNLG
jgi:hypothetical protein